MDTINDRHSDIIERKRIEGALWGSERFAQSANLAVLAESGFIIAANHSWRQFNQANSSVSATVCDGVPLVVVAHQDIGNRKQIEKALQQAFDQIKFLHDVRPLCMHSKIRDDQGYWSQREVYFRGPTKVEFSHGICPVCMKRLYPEFEQDDAGWMPKGEGDAR